MSITKHTVCLLALFAILSLASSTHQNNFRLKRQAEQDDTRIDAATADDGVAYGVVAEDTAAEDTEADDVDAFIVLNKSDKINNWTTCDWRAIPKFTCHDCNTRLICKPVGGILKFCGNAATPHCRNGFCSAIPSDDCVSEQEAEE